VDARRGRRARSQLIRALQAFSAPQPPQLAARTPSTGIAFEGQPAWHLRSLRGVEDTKPIVLAVGRKLWEYR
jgi:hypothetical protein